MSRGYSLGGRGERFKDSKVFRDGKAKHAVAVLGDLDVLGGARAQARSLELPPVFQPCPGHAFAQAALLDEGLLQLAQLAFEQVAGDADEADDHIGRNDRVGVFNAFARVGVGRIGDPVELAQPACIGVILRPFLVAAKAQKVAVVGQRLLQAGARYVDQLEPRGLAPPQPLFDSQRSIENRPLPWAITARAMPMARRWYSKPSPWPVLYQSMKKPFFRWIV